MGSEMCIRDRVNTRGGCTYAIIAPRNRFRFPLRPLRASRGFLKSQPVKGRSHTCLRFAEFYQEVCLGSVLGIAVDDEEKWCRVSLSVPGAKNMTTVDAVVILDSGSGITTMSAAIANKLQAAFPDVPVVGSMTHAGRLKVADGRVMEVNRKTCPVRHALHTSWGLVQADPFSFAVMPGDDMM